MARKPTHKTTQNIVQYYISLYYVERERDATLKSNREKHIRVADKIERDYHKELRTKYPDWDTEENRPQVQNQIDFLTKIFSQRRKEEQKKIENAERIKLMHQKVKIKNG